MTGKAKATAQPPPACVYPIAERECGEPATAQLPVGYASNSEPMPLCDLHARRFLGAAVALP